MLASSAVWSLGEQIYNILLIAGQYVQDLRRWVDIERSKRAADGHPLLPAAQEALQCCSATA